GVPTQSPAQVLELRHGETGVSGHHRAAGVLELLLDLRDGLDLVRARHVSALLPGDTDRTEGAGEYGTPRRRARGVARPAPPERAATGSLLGNLRRPSASTEPSATGSGPAATSGLWLLAEAYA